jgi:hypothetical protein
MIRAGFLASTPAALVPLQNSVIGVGAGTLFLVIGLLIVTGYRGIARTFISLPGDSPRAWARHARRRLRRAGTLRPDDDRFVRDGVPGSPLDIDLIIGVGFCVLGGFALLASLAELAVRVFVVAARRRL